MSDSPETSPAAETPARSPRGLVILSGPSGSGKSTVVDLVVQRSEVPIRETVSATTRPKREREVHGKEYWFLTEHEFRERIARGEFIEHAEVHGQGYLYGTLKSELEESARLGAWALLEIDVAGAGQVLAQFPDAITIFLRTPSDDEFEKRLRARCSESEAEIQRRLATAREELAHADRYRHQVVNDLLDNAVAEICGIVADAD